MAKTPFYRQTSRLEFPVFDQIGALSFLTEVDNFQAGDSRIIMLENASDRIVMVSIGDNDRNASSARDTASVDVGYQ